MLRLRLMLHPTDFSPRSDYAFHLAQALARDHGAELLVLHVLAEPAFVYGGGMVPYMPEQYRQEFADKLAQVEPTDPNLRVRKQMCVGDPAAEIVRIAQENQCDLIVMGTHGWTGLGRLLMGSVAEQVLRKATCPVLTVRTPFPETADSLLLEKQPNETQVEAARI